MNALRGAILGAVLLGIGGRIVMRLLAMTIAQDPDFTISGTLEILAYGVIVGAVAGAGLASCRTLLARRWWAQGILFGLLTHAATIATLPSHIAETARPFADSMTVVHLLFGSCFLLFGLTMARLSSRATSLTPEAAPAAPLE